MQPAFRRRLDERGIAILTVLLVAFAVSAIALAAVMMTLNANLIGKSDERTGTLDAVAIAALEEGRSKLNGTRTLFPATGYITIENGVAPKDANNTTIPKMTRSLYAGPTGIISGQYGVIGSLIATAQDSFGNKVVRRLEVNQESFAKFAYFTDIEEDTAGIVLSFLNNDQIRGPVHSNDTIRIAASGATFFDQVTSFRPLMIGQANGTFTKPPQLGVSRIPLPTTADLNRLDTLAQTGTTSFPGSLVGALGQGRTRIEFLTIDVGGGNFEGFFRVYQGTNQAFVSATLPTTAGFLRDSRNCGDVRLTIFLAAGAHTGLTLLPHNHSLTTAANQDSALTHATSRCYLGGDSILTAAGTLANWPTAGHFDGGIWVQAPAAINANLSAVPLLAIRPDVNYLFPLSRGRNVNFKGVIYVGGNVVVSGVLHGRVTVAASGNIIFGDDLTYYQGTTRDCTTGDIGGFFAGQSVVISNNTINAPQTTNTNMSVFGQTTSIVGVRTYDDSRDETIYGILMSLKTIGAENFNVGNTAAQPCTSGGGSTVGRGCLNTFGGIIERNRGAVTQTVSPGATGYAKRYQYDPCGSTDPPPYFPTTGVFVKNRFYEINPTRFSVAGWYTANQY